MKLAETKYGPTIREDLMPAKAFLLDLFGEEATEWTVERLEERDREIRSRALWDAARACHCDKDRELLELLSDSAMGTLAGKP